MAVMAEHPEPRAMGSDGASAFTRERRPLQTVKLNPPRASPFEVARTEICEQIYAAGAARLVLLSAPAGFGKTTVMQQLCQRFEQTGIATSWLTLDTADNDVVRFLPMLAAALDRIIPGVLPPEQPLRTQGNNLGGLALGLLDRLSAHPAPFALFLDDIESVQNPAVIGLIQELIEQLPRGGQLIAASRGLPEFGLSRLRARTRLVEIEASQLRFSVEEADNFLRRRCALALGENDVRLLHRITEGGPIALWLASLSLAGREQPGTFIAQLVASNASVIESLVEDVLTRQSEPLQDFLLRTCILDPLNAALCDAVCRRNDSAALLADLARANRFVTSLHGEPNGYRYHSVTAESLRARLASRMPEAVPLLHRAASDWFLAQGRVVPAIEHALASGDFSYALPLLAEHADRLLVQSRMRLLTRWLDPLAQAGRLRDQPLLQAIHAWAVMFSRGPREARTLLDGFDHQPCGDSTVAAHRLALRPTLLTMMDEIEEAYPLLIAGDAALPVEAVFPRAAMAISLATIAMIAGRYRDARDFVAAGRHTHRGLDMSFDTVFEAVEGAIDLTQGRLRQATARLRLATHPVEVDAARSTNGNALSGVLLAQALYEADDCEQAERLLNVYAPLIKDVVSPDQLIRAHSLLARIVAGRGDVERAFALLTELEYLGHRGGLPRAVASAKLERARFMLAHGHAAAAREELDQAGDLALWGRISQLPTRANDVETRTLGQLRWTVRAGQPELAIEPLRKELHDAEHAQRLRCALTLRLLLAEALWRSARRSQALSLLCDALALAGLEGYVRPFIDEGATVAAMLEEFLSLPAPGAESLPAVAQGLLERMRWASAASKEAAAPAATTVASSGFGEVLTRREAQVLQLLATGLSNPAIGERLFVAETTVRSHLRSINVKLDARNRTEAVAIARRLGVIR
jgi:LuxR family maltose regulon positive regulatory protein